MDALLAACGRVNLAALDRGRPLWALWLITELSEQRVDLVIRLHRVVDDGVAAQVLPVSLFDDCPTRPRPDHNRAATRFLGASTPGPSTDVNASPTDLALHTGRAPALPLNRPVGPRRKESPLRCRSGVEQTRAAAISPASGWCR